MTRLLLLVAMLLCMFGFSPASAAAQDPCKNDVFLGELASQLDTAESLLEAGDFAQASRILLEVHAQDVPVRRSRKTVAARCSGRLLFALSRATAGLGERDAALEYLQALRGVPTRPALQQQGVELEARLSAQVRLVVQLPSWTAAAGAAGELTARSSEHTAHFTHEGLSWQAYVNPGAAYELTFTAELFEVLSLQVTTASGGEQKLALDDLVIVLAPSSPEIGGDALAAFREGRARASRGEWGQALIDFQRAAAAGGHSHVDFNLAYARMKVGQAVMARDGFFELESAQVPAWLKLQAKRHRERLDLEAVAVVQLVIPDGSVSMRVNGRALVVAGGDSMRLGDPVEMPGTRLASTTLRVAVGDSLDFELASPHDVVVTGGERTHRETDVHHFELSPAPGSHLSVVLRPVATTIAGGEAMAADGSEGPNFVGPIVLGAVAVVASVVATVAFLNARDLRDDSPCDHARFECEDEGQVEDMKDAQGLADIATVASVIGAAAGAAAVGWLMLELLWSGPEESQSAVQLRLGPTGADVTVAF